MISLFTFVSLPSCLLFSPHIATQHIPASHKWCVCVFVCVCARAHTYHTLPACEWLPLTHCSFVWNAHKFSALPSGHSWPNDSCGYKTERRRDVMKLTCVKNQATKEPEPARKFLKGSPNETKVPGSDEVSGGGRKRRERKKKGKTNKFQHCRHFFPQPCDRD